MVKNNQIPVENINKTTVKWCVLFVAEFSAALGLKVAHAKTSTAVRNEGQTNVNVEIISSLEPSKH